MREILKSETKKLYILATSYKESVGAPYNDLI